MLEYLLCELGGGRTGQDRTLQGAGTPRDAPARRTLRVSRTECETNRVLRDSLNSFCTLKAVGLNIHGVCR